MARPHIERYDLRAAPWRRVTLLGCARGLDGQVLSVDPASGAASLRLRLARGLTRPGGYGDAELELYVLAGAIELGGARHGAGSYLCVPPGVALPPLASPRGAELLAFSNGGPPGFTASDSDHPSAARDGLIALDAAGALRWEAGGGYPAARPGRLVKVLRSAPGSRALSCLIALAPQYRHEAIGYHDCATESYLIAGDYWSLQAGACAAGSYAWRPPWVNQGPARSERGALLFLRSDAELAEHLHLNPWSTPAENRARAASRLASARPALCAALGGRRAPRRARTRARASR